MSPVLQAVFPSLFRTQVPRLLRLRSAYRTFSSMSGADQKLQPFPLAKVRTPQTDRPLLALVCCGSFSPVTFLHLRLMEAAKDYLSVETESFEVVAGFLSPVNDAYGKKDLQYGGHRLDMTRLAVESSDWLSVATWEMEQPQWSRTYSVLDAAHTYLNEALRPKFKREVHVKLVCGADLLAACLDAQVWPLSDLQKVFRHGVVCLERVGHNSQEIIFQNDILYHARNSIHLVPQRITNNISSTAVRLNIKRGVSIRYLVPDAVERYIREHNLYR